MEFKVTTTAAAAAPKSHIISISHLFTHRALYAETSAARAYCKSSAIFIAHKSVHPIQDEAFAHLLTHFLVFLLFLFPHALALTHNPHFIEFHTI